MLSASLPGLDTAAIEEPLRATLLMLGKLTREHAVDADDMRAVLAAGASRQQIEDALAVSFSFNVIGRLADAFGFFVPGSNAFEIPHSMPLVTWLASSLKRRSDPTLPLKTTTLSRNRRTSASRLISPSETRQPAMVPTLGMRKVS